LPEVRAPGTQPTILAPQPNELLVLGGGHPVMADGLHGSCHKLAGELLRPASRPNPLDHLPGSGSAIAAALVGPADVFSISRTPFSRVERCPRYQLSFILTW